MNQVVKLETAAGSDKCSEAIRYLNVDAGFEETYALVLKDTPTVLSMGMAVIDKGWHFEWPAGSFAPFAIRPDGVIVWFIVIDYVVYFRRNQDAASVNQMSSVVAAARRRHSTKTPPSTSRGMLIHLMTLWSFCRLRLRFPKALRM